MRFRVVTCTGTPINLPVRERGGGTQIGVSATVIDGAWNAREVRTFRSEHRRRGSFGPTYGRAGALEAALELAARLNAKYADG